MFIRSKKHGKKNYYYLVKSERTGNKISQRVVRYLGTARPSPKVIADVIAAVSKSEKV
jgi:hypothetical protein